jgi:hypothetical protein
MAYHLAQLNVARFRVPQEDPVNADFMNALDRVNAIAEEQPGFVWRLTGEGNDATDVRAFDDPQVAVNLSVWTDLDALSDFVYRNEAHLGIMRRRREWFDRMEAHMVLWWVEAGHEPAMPEALQRLECLRESGPTPQAFTFREAFPPGEGSGEASSS